MNELLRMVLETQENEDEVHEEFAALEYRYPYHNERVPRAKQALSERLQAMGDEAVPLLLEGLTEPRFDARLAIEALGEATHAAVRPLLDLLERGTPYEVTCRMALRRLSPPAAILLEEIEAGRTKAAEVMGAAQGDPRVLPRLFVLLRGGTPSQQLAAAIAITSAVHRLGAEHAPALGEALGSPVQGVSEAAAQALEGMGAAARGAVAELRQALVSGSALTRRAAAAALQKIDLEDVTPFLAQIDDPDEWVRQNVARALIQGRHLAAVPALIEHLERVHTERREQHLLKALVELAGDAAAPHLVRWVHPRGVYREDYVYALGCVDAPVGVRALVDLLAEVPLREGAAMALAMVWKRAVRRVGDDELAVAEVLAGGHPPTREFLLRCAEEGPEELASVAQKITSVDWVRSIRSILVMAEHERTRRRAWELLEKHREHAQAALPWLIEQLALHDSSAPSEALKILSHWGPAAAPAVPALLGLLGREVPCVSSFSVCWILERIGPPAVSAAETVARYNPGCEAYFGLPDVETAASFFAAKLEGVSDDEPHLRAIKHLGSGARGVVPRILAGSFRPGVPLWVRREAIATLGALGGEEAEHALIELVSGSAWFREAAVPALARLATPAAVLALGNLLGDPAARGAAARALVQLSESASAVLAELFADARALAAWEGPDAVVDALLRLVPTEPVVWACCTLKAAWCEPELSSDVSEAIDSLQRLGFRARGAVELLRSLLASNPDVFLAGRVERIVERATETQALLDEKLEELNHPDPWKGDSAAQALADRGALARPAVPATGRWLQRAKKANRRWNIEALGDIGGSEAMAVLLDHWPRHEEDRRGVALALGRVLWGLRRGGEPLPEHQLRGLVEQVEERILRERGAVLLRAEQSFVQAFARHFVHAAKSEQGATARG